MRYTTQLVGLASLATYAAASNAPVVKNNPIAITYAASLPNTNAGALTGQVKVAAAPNGEGVAIQIALFNLPTTGGNLSYGIHSGTCASGAGVLDPYGGVTGAACMTNMASCQIGDLSDKHGALAVTQGGSGTGYFSANYVDEYLSMVPGTQAFIGDGSFLIADSTGATVNCANFMNADKVAASNSTSSASGSATSGGAQSTAGSGSGRGGNGGSGSSSGSSGSSSASASSTSSGLAIKTVAPVVGAGLAGLMALML